MADSKSTSSAGIPVGVDLALWERATPAQQEVLRRIAVQRERLRARAAAHAQARALASTQETRVRPDAPLVERIVSFTRLHPIAVAAAGAAAVVVGPRKLFRLGSVLLPWILKLQQKSRS
ncbi:hypothetical protein [Comamonas terrae]|uniref:DUF3618 domain-containing protein n=1 Tax=Comamonas terrae TaxID=673548 RepID=A0ABW5ULK5_9BURK|nr:hypothetical protein [Comamonas terrae]